MILREYKNIDGRITATVAIKCKCGRIGPRVPMRGPNWDSIWDDHKAAVAAAKEGWKFWTKGAVEFCECPFHLSEKPKQLTLSLEENQ